jgi:hypothetical protein
VHKCLAKYKFPLKHNDGRRLSPWLHLLSYDDLGRNLESLVWSNFFSDACLDCLSKVVLTSYCPSTAAAVAVFQTTRIVYAKYI